MTTHAEHCERISAFIDGQLADGEEAAVFSHLSRCADCRHFLGSAIELRRRLVAARPVRSPSNRRSRPDGRKVDPLVLAWQKRVPLPVAASIAVLIMLGSLAVSARLFASESSSPSAPLSAQSGAMHVPSLVP